MNQNRAHSAVRTHSLNAPCISIIIVRMNIMLQKYSVLGGIDKFNNIVRHDGVTREHLESLMGLGLREMS